MSGNDDSFARLWLLHYKNIFGWGCLYLYIDHLFLFTTYLRYGHNFHVAERKEKYTIIIVMKEKCSVTRMNREEKTLGV